MSLFFITFFSLYALTHAYAFIKAKAALAFGTRASILLIIFMLVMVSAPVIVRLSEKAGHETIARFTAYIGYTWLGVIFLFTSYSVLADAWRLLVFAAGFISKSDLSALNLSARYAFFIPLLLSLLTSTYGYFEAKDIRTERVTIKTPKISAAVGSLRIVQISDVHLGLINREEKLRSILKIVKTENPDILVSTGDLVDGDICGLNGLSELLKEVRPKYGKFAITGNHEYYAGLDNSICFTENAGFAILRGEAVSVADAVIIAGVDDPTGRILGISDGAAENELLSSLPPEKFILFLKHRPLIDKRSVGLFDLQLSGHVHKGQIFPFSIITWLYYPIQSGFARLQNGSSIYVSRGAGTWGPPIRFLAPPEVAVIDLVPAAAK